MFSHIVMKLFKGSVSLNSRCLSLKLLSEENFGNLQRHEHQAHHIAIENHSVRSLDLTTRQHWSVVSLEGFELFIRFWRILRKDINVFRRFLNPYFVHMFEGSHEFLEIHLHLVSLRIENQDGIQNRSHCIQA